MQRKFSIDVLSTNTINMKKLNLILLLALFIFWNDAAFSGIINHSTFQDERAVSNFKGVASGGPLNVQISMGNNESIRFEGDQEAIADLITEVKEGILIIRPKTKWSDWSRKYRRPDITVFITAKKITSLTLSGSGNIEVLNPINCSELATTLSGSGSIKAKANTRSFAGVVSGSGTVSVSGKADNSTLTVSGSGNFQGKSFAVNTISVQISGSANVYVNASKEIDAVISGSGNIVYSGDPLIKKTIIGSGSITKK